MTLPFVRDLLMDLAQRSPLVQVTAGLNRRQLMALSGLTPTAQLLATAQLQRMTRRQVVLIVADNRTAEEWQETLAAFAGLTRGKERVGDEDVPWELPGYEIDPYEGMSPHEAILSQQAMALWRWSSGGHFLIAPAVAAITKLGKPEDYQRLARTLRRGDFLDLAGFEEQLGMMGYRRAEPVEQPGQFSVRGGLIDAFSPDNERPVRIEMVGDEIESLREFDPATQRSVQTVEQTLLVSLLSLPLHPERRRRLDELGSGATDPGWEFRIPGLEGFQHSIFDLAPEALVLVAEPEAVQGEIRRWWKRLRQRCEALTATADPDRGDAAPPAPESIFFTPEEFGAMLTRQRGVEMRELDLSAAATIDLDAEAMELRARAGSEWTAPAGSKMTVAYSSRPSPRYQGAVARMVEELRAAVERGERWVFLGSNAGEVERLGDLFTEYNLPFQLGVRVRRGGDDYLAEKSYFSAEAPGAIVAQGALLRGFSLPELKITFLGSNDLFGVDESAAAWSAPAPSGRRTKLSSFLSDFRDLTPGDYVVHVEHGIGCYVGLKSFAADDSGTSGGTALAASSARGESGEFMILEYADSAKLYVPLTRMDLVQKYRSAEGAKPTLDRLGGTQWAQRKSRVKKAMKDMADELLKLYAARQAITIPPCPPDGNWQREFEDSFPYSETTDQQKAIDDVRRDLESSRPMDRLVVGDVGYGKTEVAMRAAFKIVSENRQVAILAPTTVLAFQHEQTFRQRFRAFPMQIDMLSRFRSRPQQKETLEKVAAGKVDIVIGTHRLLSKDVQFQNLGLLVVDEEQRFGVRHKERMKQLRKEIHVLTLSATPIPRTLNMSLAGLRDLSIIETPPRDRLAIQTVVAAWDENLIGAALRQELERGGQVYFVHNRVDTIWEIAAMLQKLAPQARIVVGHGQMDEDELENTMLKFIRHEADVLLSTTIIENGLDIPMANTMIVNRADRLGLSELYQLRGRVGRSNRRAYAYLLVPAEAELTPVARKRLAAMREFSDLGAGFKIAALDLELRGAGNLLGGEQSGNLDAVGFDLYVQMLEQTVRELKGEEVQPELEIQLHLGLDIRIPPEYVPEENQRLRLYKRLAEAETEQQREDVVRELRDRYGPPPAAVQNLLAYASLRPLCRELGLQGLERRRDQLWLRFTPQSKVDPKRLARLVERSPGAQFTPQGLLKLPFAVSGATAVLAELSRVLGELRMVAPKA